MVYRLTEYINFFPKEFYGCMRQIKTSPMKLNLVAKLVSDGCYGSDVMVVM